ncbi:FAD-binding oxidoreductase [Aquipuribacter nitratireducens]|uniref:FAD-binding oxidoreductase n=1 Tax=Aquipuribacter nitratireducens TaxID=650104 RepID=A0ABW0GR95_9MICO
MTPTPGSVAPTGGWRSARVAAVDRPGPAAVRLRLDVADRVSHLPGQHYVVRLTAPDGYTASRSYSVASAPGDPLVELYVERLVDGEVSGYLADVLEPGDELEVRGPVGGWFVWDGTTPALAVGGGSGVVPLVSMLRHARDTGRPELLCLVGAARTAASLPYAEEMLDGCTLVALSQEDSPAGRPAGRLRAADLAPLVDGRDAGFVCGSAGFAETASQALVAAGMPADRVRVERFGPSG